MRLKKKVKYNLYGIALATVLLAINLLVPTPSYQTASLERYLEENIAWNNTGGVITDAYKIYGEKEDELYLWYTFEEWNRENQDIEAGASLPVVILLNEQEEAVGHKVPDDGSNYTNSVKELFPFYVRVRMNHDGVPLSLRQSINIQQKALPPVEEEEAAGNGQ
ncbi:hypothetical protein [Jeotgalibacillus proteolyticus]|uniref:Uncharacterized protein n=1 Tax=Jeotgalibacillus proteolyticus TaxID=2082395 RepID=A0A2S5GA52_9BACL|nr:hypothetical protein [Jeotgalibacillus proteolyticus]PPA69794.1 hypothetical protein C4B60_14760 [Jeotgalibacillus proteolyticus]